MAATRAWTIRGAGMSNSVVDPFRQALERLEQSGDVEPMVALFAEDARIGNASAGETLLQGSEAVRNFWKVYRETFREVRSTFRGVLADDARAALEWTSEGMLHTGAPIRYDGVSVIEAENGRITRFYAYFNPAILAKERLAVRITHLDSEDLVREIP